MAHQKNASKNRLMMRFSGLFCFYCFGLVVKKICQNRAKYLKFRNLFRNFFSSVFHSFFVLSSLPWIPIVAMRKTAVFKRYWRRSEMRLPFADRAEWFCAPGIAYRRRIKERTFPSTWESIRNCFALLHKGKFPKKIPALCRFAITPEWEIPKLYAKVKKFEIFFMQICNSQMN